jgi:hypothetical protein
MPAGARVRRILLRFLEKSAAGKAAEARGRAAQGLGKAGAFFGAEAADDPTRPSFDEGELAAQSSGSS